MARDAKEFGAGIAFAPQPRKPACATAANRWRHGDAFNIIDRCWAPIQPDIRRKWRLQARHALFTFKAFNERRFLAANIRTRPVMHVNIIGPTGTGCVFTQEPVSIRLVNGALQSFAFAHKLAAHVNVTRMCAHGETSKQAPFQQFMRLMAHNIAVFARAGLRFVGINDQIMRTPIIFFRHERPFQTRRKSGPATTAQARRFDLFNDPVTTLSNQVSRIVPISARLRGSQIGTMEPVNIGKNTIFIA